MEAHTLNLLKGKKILVATSAALGHFRPLTGLAHLLMTSGCEVRWYTTKMFKDEVESMGFPFYPYQACPELDNPATMPFLIERMGIADEAERAAFDMEHFFVVSAPGNFDDISAIREDFLFDLVITDSTFPAIPLIRTLDVPVVSIGVIPLALDSADLGPVYQFMPPPLSAEQKIAADEIKHHLLNVVFRREIEDFSAVLAEYNVAPSRSILFDDLIRRADLYLQIGSPSFEYTRNDMPNNVRFVGALLPYQSQENTVAWFDEKINHYDKIVLVTQGTVERDTSKLLEPVLEAFKDTDVLVIATTGGNRTKELREQYASDHIIIEDYIPFDDIMSYADIFITNGGYSGTILSISNELPMIAAGVHEGKAEVCRRIGYFNCGINLDTEFPTAIAIREAADKIFTDPVYKQQISIIAQEMRNYKPLELSMGYIAQLLEKTQTV